MVDSKTSSPAYKTMWKFTREVVEARLKAQAKAQPRSKQPKQRAISQSDRKFNPQPADGFEMDCALRYLPEGAKVWKDQRENRWVIRYPPFGAISRSWTVYGEVGAFGRCAAWAWAMHSQSGQGNCPFPWVSRLDWRSAA